MKEQLESLCDFLKSGTRDKRQAFFYNHDRVVHKELAHLIQANSFTECDPVAEYTDALHRKDECAWATFVYTFINEQESMRVWGELSKNDWLDLLDKLTALSPWPEHHFITGEMYQAKDNRWYDKINPPSLTNLLKQSMENISHTVPGRFLILLPIPEHQENEELQENCTPVIFTPWGTNVCGETAAA